MKRDSSGRQGGQDQDHEKNGRSCEDEYIFDNPTEDFALGFEAGYLYCLLKNSSPNQEVVHQIHAPNIKMAARLADMTFRPIMAHENHPSSEWEDGISILYGKTGFCPQQHVEKWQALMQETGSEKLEGTG